MREFKCRNDDVSAQMMLTPMQALRLGRWLVEYAKARKEAD